MNQTPETGNSSNMKTRARKIVETVAYDPKDNVQMKPFKNIKKSKWATIN